MKLISILFFSLFATFAFANNKAPLNLVSHYTMVDKGRIYYAILPHKFSKDQIENLIRNSKKLSK